MNGTQNTDSTLLWESFRATRSDALKRQLAVRYSGMVKGVLRSMSIHTAPPLEEQDLLQIGYLGLDDAINRFDPTRGVKFETYAQLRIRGVIVDELRRIDWVPRTVREHLSRYRRIEARLQQERGEEASPDAVFQQMSAAGMAVDGIWSVVQAYDVVSLSAAAMAGDQGEQVSIADSLPAQDDDVLSILIRDEMRGEILRIMRTLPEPQHSVLELHYYKGVAFQDIADLLGVSGARISQIHKKAIDAMRDKLKEVLN